MSHSTAPIMLSPSEAVMTPQTSDSLSSNAESLGSHLKVQPPHDIASEEVVDLSAEWVRTDREKVEDMLQRDAENRPNRRYIVSPGANFRNYLQKELHNTDDGDSSVFLPSRNKFQRIFEATSVMSSPPECSASSTSANETPDLKTTTAFFEKLSLSNEPSLGAEVQQLLADYREKKLTASKAVHEPILDGIRTPTQLWSDYDFSKSMPGFASRASHNSELDCFSMKDYAMEEDLTLEWIPSTFGPHLLKKQDSPLEQAASLSPFRMSNFWEPVAQQPVISYGGIKSVGQLLNLLDMETYAEVLDHHGIDLVTFLTLTDVDLQELGIGYRARRKMSAAISAIRVHKFDDCSLQDCPWCRT